ncbi:hypothetical protein BGZ95_004702 [Linnemannia exigua]|uniref:ABC transporter n=1 Tax=Linnemannia exigua TaxID=604196 RepID=A0AAD4H8W1_9FUNG|nr:hypothetical protein BGZ95_004702 [Linnemannia exigua]
MKGLLEDGAIQATLPLVYSIASALTLVYLSRKRVHLGQYDALRDSEQQDNDDDDIDAGQESANPTSIAAASTSNASIDVLQAQYQAQQNAGISISLARLGLTFTQLGLIIFTTVSTSTLQFNNSNDAQHRFVTRSITSFGLEEIVQILSWSYILALTLIHLIRPRISYQYWVRPQMDLFYLLQWILSTVSLVMNNEAHEVPVSEWSLGLRLGFGAWLVNLALLWTTIMTRPYQPLTDDASTKKLKTGEIPRLASSEYNSSLYTRLTYAWINSLVYLGFKRTLQDVDLPNLEDSDRADHSIRIYDVQTGKTFSRRLLLSLRWEFFWQFTWAMPWCIMTTASPYCLNKIIQYIECKDCGPPTAAQYIWVFALLGASIVESLCFQTALHYGRRIFVHTTSICNSAVFAKALKRKDMASPVGKEDDKDDGGKKKDDEDKKKDNSANISNLVAVDIKKLEMPFSYFFQMYATPFQFLIAGAQLYNLLGNAALVGVAFMIASYPIPAKLYAMIMKLFKDIMNTKDERMDALNEMLGAIRIVKFFGWEEQFVKKITAAREKELKRTKDSYVQIVFADIVWMLTPLLNMVVILLAYTKLFGNEITASKIFTTLALFNIMRQALNSLPWNIKTTMQAIVSMNRINKFLSDEEIVLDTTVTKLDPKARLSTATLLGSDAAAAKTAGHAAHPTIGFVNASFIWPSKEHEDVDTKDVKKNPSWIQRIKSKFSKKSATPDQEPAVTEAAPIKERFKLKNISADFPVGQLSLVVGPTGSGKSALLLALLGELEKLEGNMYLPRLDYPTGQPPTRSRRHQHRTGGSGIAYVSQTAWLQNTTIRANILFGKEFDQDRYDAVVEGCALVTDFEILESGDNTEIGEQGITLSGGQKQRVSLARAIYSDADVLLLDDCLSAVDSHTGKHLFQTLTGPLLEGRTIVMATHQVQLTLSAASTVLVLDKGEVLGMGTPEEAVSKDWVENVTLSSSAQSSDDSSEISTLNGESKTKKDDTIDDGKAKKKEKISVKLTEEEKKQEGAVAWRVYKTYLNASGGWIFWTGLIGIFFLREIVDVGQNAWLAVWANKMAENTGAFVIKTFNTITPAPLTQAFYAAFAPHDGSEYGIMTMNVFGKGTPETVSVDFYLGIYVLLSICAMILGSLNLYYVVMGGLKASRVLHERLLKSITRAKVRFFDTTPMGRIINRFSSDISTIDDEVSNGIQGLFGCVTTLTGIIVIISLNMPIFLVAAFFIVIIYGVIGALYIPISRDLKRLNSNSKSPILNHFNESLSGLATIRAYGFQKRFLSKNMINLDDNNRTFFLLWSTNRWLHWRVDVVGASVAFITGILVLQNYGLIEPGWAALSLTYSLMFTGNVVWFIRMYAMNEMNLNSVERVVEYMDLESEPAPIIEGSRPPASWPHAGEIKIDHLTMRYAPDTPEVIKDVSLKIHPGEKVGVVGRTGSGKSTLAISLFRFMDPASGSITIDGIDICKIGLQDLRSNLTIIPQDPILFKGTLRSNLDPFGEREDRELWEALRRSHLIPAENKSVLASAAASKRNSLDISSVSEAGPSSGGSKSPASSIKPASSSSSSENSNGIIDSSKITLDTPVKENGSNFSQGQRQLIALARALVRQSKIIVMDEATASVDFETDLKIQMTIREEMADATILTIAHRIRTIADFDRVLVMNAGEVVEFDAPYRLMRQEDSLFRSMCERSSEFEALLAIAEEKERRDLAAGRLVDV